VRERICSSEPVASVSMGTMRPPLCTGIFPKSRVVQPASAASAAGARNPQATNAAAAAALTARPRMKRNKE